jgi:dTDP-4-dehydrorhamnose 3,5-epimerase
MKLTETKLNGVFVIEPKKLEDERGFFARIFDKKEFSKRNLVSEFVQSSISYNKKKGTIRGMHYQSKPYEESKIVGCTKGKFFDVIIDLRPYSKTFKKWFSIELSADNYEMLYIPNGFAHGFQTLADNTEVFYQISQYHMPNYSKGILWNDENFNIRWPLKPSIISKKDLTYTSFNVRES